MKWLPQILLTVVALCAHPTSALPETRQAHPLPVHAAPSRPARRLAIQGVPNFLEVSPRLYRGGQPSPAGLQSLARIGIGIVVDGRKFDRREQDEVTQLGMRYIAIPWHCPFPRDRVFAQFLSVIRGNPDQKIFVHCRLGDDRVGMMIASYRMAEEGWTAEQAMQEMKANGFTSSHHFICPGLARYEKQFPYRLKTNPIFHPAR